MKALRSCVFFAAAISACATVHHVETTPVLEQMAESLRQVDINAELAEKDYASQVKSEATRDAFGRLTLSLNDMRQLRKDLHADHDDFASRVGSRDKIKTNEKDFGANSEIVRKFDLNTQAFNRAYSDYVSASRDLKKVVVQKELNVAADVEEVRKRVKKIVDRGNKNLAVYELGIKSAQMNAEQNGNPLNETAKRRLHTEYEEYEARLKRLEESGAFLREKLAGRRKIESSDPDWSEFRRHVTLIEDSSREMNEIGDKLKKDLDVAQLKSSK